MTNSEPRNQHYVPRCLLDLFSIEKNRHDQPLLWVISKNGKNKRKSITEEIFAKNNIYTKVVGSKKIFGIEKTLGNIEGDFATLYRDKVSKRLPLSDVEHLNLCAFVATLMQRTLRFKKNIESFYDQRIALIKSSGMEPPMVAQAVAKLEIEKKDAHKEGLMGSFPAITQLLVQTNVAFFCAEKSGTNFIISDDPCQLFNSRLQWQKCFGPGLKQEDTEVYLPLSKDTLLLLSWSNYRGYFPLNSHEVNDRNRMTRAYAHKEIATSMYHMKLVWRSPLPLSYSFFLKFLFMQLRIILQRVFFYFKYDRP